MTAFWYDRKKGKERDTYLGVDGTPVSIELSVVLREGCSGREGKEGVALSIQKHLS